jgi:Lipocalin-like domain
MSDAQHDPRCPDPRFLGAWRLDHVDRVDSATGEELDANVKGDGFIAYTPDGRMSVVISRDEPGKPRVITCYAAKWSLDGDKVYHDIDIASRPQWTGTRQVRHFTFHGDMLTLQPPESPDVVHGKVTRRALHWRKVT